MSDDEAICAEAKALIEQACDGEHNDRYDSLMEQAYRLLLPLVDRGVADAQYLHSGSTLNLEGLDDESFEKRRIDLVRNAAEAGHARAQFTLGQMYEPDAELPADAAMSAYWFEKSALQGYPYAQWVHGLNLLNGTGLDRNEALALDFIRRAAEGRFEGAIEFVADAYAAGSHGFPNDEAAAAMWRQRLLEPGVLSY
jgi:TPR repeat protein